ncbi:MAG: hypothetical protein ACOCTT_00040 [archaeon]
MKRNWKTGCLKGISLVLTLVLTLHMLSLPVSAAPYNSNVSDEDQEEYTDEELPPLKTESISDSVEIVELDWKEVERLLDQTGNVTFDGFGDKSAYDEYKAREEAGISDTPGINNTENKFITTNEGETVMLYDLLEHRAIDPTEVPHLSHMVTTGHMSYTTLLEETTRICPEYPDETCETGHLNPQKRNELQEEINEKERAINEASEVARDVAGPMGETLESITYQMGFAEYENVTEFFEGETKDLEELKAEIGDESPLNAIQSNYSISHLQRTDSTLLFPHHLAKFTQFLESLQPGDRMYSVALGISVATSLGSVAQSMSGLKMAKKGTDAVDNLDAVTKKADKAISNIEAKMKTGDLTQDQMDVLNAKKSALKALKSKAKSADSVDDFQDSVKGTRIGGDTTKGSQASESFDDAIKNIENNKETLDSFEGLNANDEIENYQLAKRLVNAEDSKQYTSILNDIDSTEKANEVQDILKTQGGISEFNDVTKTLGGTDGDELMKALGRHDAYYGDVGQFMGTTMDTTSKKGKLLTALTDLGVSRRAIGIRALSGFRNSVSVFQGSLVVSFIPLTFFGQPKPTFELMTLSMEAEPNRVIEDKDAYLEIARATDRAYGQDFYPAGVFENLLNFFNFDLSEITGENDADIVRRKIEQNPGPGYVKVIDQETSAEQYSEKPINMIYPQRIGDGTGEKWMINSINPTMTDYQAFEHPKSYVEGNKNLFSTFTLIIKNLNLGGLTTVEEDWAEHSHDYLVDYTPTTKTMVYGSAIGGILTGIAPGGMFTGRTGTGVLKGVVATLMLKGWGSLAQEEAERMQDQKYGEVVDIGEAYKEGEPCSAKLDELESDIQDMRRWMWVTIIGNTGADITSMAITSAATATTGPFGLAVTATNIGFSIANYYYTREYQTLKTDGLEEMKECQETMFEVLALKAMPTEDKQSEDMLEQIKGDLGEGLSGIPGIESISPETSDALKNLGPTSYQNIMALSGKIEGKSLINLLGSELYQVHLDREADIKWFLEEQQNIDFCYQTDTTMEERPIFECIQAQGYTLLDPEGRPIIDAPQTKGFRWDNDRELMTIPQKVINTKQETGELMEIERDEVRIDDQDTQEAVQKLTGNSYTKDIFGELQTIKTEEAVIWHDGNTAVARFTEPVGGEIGRGKVLRFDDAHIQTYKDNQIEIQSNADNEKLLDHTFELGENGFLSFENGKIVPGSGQHELNINNQTATRDFGEWNHIILYDLLSFTADRADDYDIEGLEYDEDGNIVGFEMGGDFPDEHQDQMDALLEEMAFNDLVGPDGRRMRIEDGELIYVDETGEETRSKIIGFEDGKIQLEDGRELELDKGPDGQPQAQFYRDGEPVGAPIPLLRASGVGGMMGYDPQTGEISISNEFPFQMNPQFGDIGAGMTNPGMMIPQQSEFGGRPPEPGVDFPREREPGLIAELPSTPGRESQLGELDEDSQETEMEPSETSDEAEEEKETGTTLPINKIALILFILTILGGVLAIRKKGRKIRVKKN